MRILFAIALLTGGLASAEILESGPGGFRVKTTLIIKVPPEDVYRKFVHQIGDWWNPQHTFSGDSHNLRIEEHPGGCFCEKLPNNGFSRHLEVILLAPGKRMVMSGALGPLQLLAAVGTMSVQFAQEGAGTKFEVIYSVSGYLEKGINTWAIPVDLMTSEQFYRFKRYVETGQPAESK